MDTIYADAQEFAQVFYNIDRTLFRWKAGNMFGHNSYQFRLAMAAWDEIQQDSCVSVCVRGGSLLTEVARR